VKWLKRIALGSLLVTVLGLGVASVDRCGAWVAAPGGLTGLARSKGALRVGAAKAAFDLPYPVTLGGYGPWLHQVGAAATPLAARATVLEVGGQRFGLVSLETLLVTDSVVSALRKGGDFQVWVVATHTHTGPGNFDPRLVARVAALGPYRADVEAAIVKAGAQALSEAISALAPAVMDVAVDSHDLTRSRSGGEIDTTLARIRFRSPEGAPLAQWLLFGGHPTMVARSTELLDGDFPSRVSARFEASGGVAMVLQTAGANASANGSLDDFSAELTQRFARLADGPAEPEVTYGLATSDVVLSRPDAQRLVPGLLTPALENALCDQPTTHAEIGVLRLGSISLVAVPLEVTSASARVLTQQSKASHLLSLANGYQGYLEPEQVVRSDTGEAHAQYFGPGLLSQLAEAAQRAGEAAGTFGAKTP